MRPLRMLVLWVSFLRMTQGETEQAIVAFTEDRTPERQLTMERALLAGQFLVPIGDEDVKARGDRYRLPVRCFRTDEGLAAAPAFTSLERLFDWKPEGCRYVTLDGHKIIDMVFAMPEVEVIAVNPKGVPRGLIPREEFLRLLAMHHGVQVTDVERGGARPRRKSFIIAMGVVVGVVVIFSIAIAATRF